MAGYATTAFTIIGTYYTGRGLMVEAQRSLYNAATSASDDNGEWMDTFGWESFVIYVNNISGTQSVNCMGSNASSIPANSAHGVALATALTADGYFKIEGFNIPRFVKVYLSGTSGGTSDVDIKVRRYAGNTQ